MRTTNKCFKEKVQEHILNSCLNEEYGSNQKEQLQAVKEGFYDWYSGYEQKRTPNRYEAFKEWSLGLPSQFNIEYTYYNIEETVKTWFIDCGETYKEPKDDSKTHDLYYHLVTREFNTLCKKNGIDF